MNVTVDGFFYWWSDLLDSLTQRVIILNNALLHTHTISVHSRVFISRCSVAASKSGLSACSVFPNYPQNQLRIYQSNSSKRLNLSSSLTNLLSNSVTRRPTNATRLNSTQLTLTICPAGNVSARTTQKTQFHQCCIIFAVETFLLAKPLYSNCLNSCFFRGRCLANGCTCHNINKV
jgi:hypothetical protein